MSVGGDDCTAEIYNTGDTVRQTWEGFAAIITTAVTTGFFSGGGASTAIAYARDASSSTVRGLSGTVYSPRDATKKTSADGKGFNDGGNQYEDRSVIAAAAADDDTIRFVAQSGTLTGSVEIEWYYA